MLNSSLESINLVLMGTQKTGLELLRWPPGEGRIQGVGTFASSNS